MTDSPFRLLYLFGIMFSFIGGIISTHGIIMSEITLTTFSVLIFGLCCIIISHVGSWIDYKLYYQKQTTLETNGENKIG